MELTLRLTRLDGRTLPLNYSYAVSSWIYSVIQRADSGYSHFLHNQGFGADGRAFKMFTFSQLDLRPYRIEGDSVRLLGNEVSLSVRFFVDTSLEHFVRGLFMHQQFRLYDRFHKVVFEVSRVDSVARVNFSQRMQYRCLSPICVSRQRPDGSAEYVSPADSQFGELLVNNLVRKARALQVDSGDSFDPGSVRFRLLNTPRKKGIHIKGGTAAHTQVIGYLFHFELEVPSQLHEIGYYAGFGEKNSMGFGCVGVEERRKETSRAPIGWSNPSWCD